MNKIPIGTVIAGTYEITGIIGSGGGGITYKARHLRLQTDVVVKKIRDEVVSRVNIRAEADILKNLKHACLPRVYDFIQTRDGVYTVIDFIPGDNLEDAVKKHGPFDYAQVLKWTNQLSETLAYLHSQTPPIIHSDIKPANIMLTDKGNICLIDFNISLALGDTMESAVGVSPGFSPPEQFVSIDSYVRMVTETMGTCSLSGYTGGYSGNTSNHRTDINKTVTSLGAWDDETVQSIGSFEDDDETVPITDTPYANAPDSDATVAAFNPYNSDETLSVIDTYDGDATVSVINRGIKTNKASYVTAPKIREYSGPGTFKTRRTEYSEPMGRGIDSRSDIYSLGMTLIYLLTGVKSSLDFELRVTLDDTNVYIPEGFETIIRKMISFDPDLRYRDGSALLNALRNIHKLDGRYRSAHRTQLVMQITALLMFIAGIGLSAYGFLSQRNTDNSLYNKYLDEAEKCMESGELDEAEALIDEAFSIDDEKGDAYREQIYLLYLGGDYEGAIDEGTSYINSPTFREWLTGKAEDTFKVSAQSTGDIYYLIGNSYYELGEYQRAADYLEQAIEFNNTNGLYYRDYAIALAKLSRTGEALKELVEAKDLGLADDSVYLVNGQIAYADGDYQEAVSCFKETMKITESEQVYKRALFMCSDAYKAMGSGYADDDIEMLCGCMDRFDGTSALMVREYLAKAYMIKAEEDPSYNEKALEQFQEMVSSGYSSFQIRENIAVIYGNLGKYDEAEDILLKLSEEYPENYEVYKDLAFIEMYSEAEKDVSERDYHKFKSYLDKAESLCTESDDEMEMLKRAEQELIDGGWEIN